MDDLEITIEKNVLALIEFIVKNINSIFLPR